MDLLFCPFRKARIRSLVSLGVKRDAAATGAVLYEMVTGSDVSQADVGGNLATTSVVPK